MCGGRSVVELCRFSKTKPENVLKVENIHTPSKILLDDIAYGHMK